MEYITTEEILIYPEYGRNVQDLVKYAVTIEDKKERTEFVNRIIKLMYQILPINKNSEDFKDKIWNHVMHMADYKLDVDIPDDVEILRPENKKQHPRLAYPEHDTKFRHYGHNIQAMINKAMEMDDKEKQDEFVKVIGNYMKMAYKNWNREHFVNDEMIIQDLERLSNGQFVLDENATFRTPVKIDTSPRSNNRRRQNNRKGRSNSNSSNRGRKSNNNNSNNNRNRKRR